MAIINQRPKGVQVQVKDTVSKESKSFTIHGIHFNKLFTKLFVYATQLAKFKSIRLVCYKQDKIKEDLDDEEKTDETTEQN